MCLWLKDDIFWIFKADATDSILFVAVLLTADTGSLQQSSEADTVVPILK